MNNQDNARILEDNARNQIEFLAAKHGAGSVQIAAELAAEKCDGSVLFGAPFDAELLSQMGLLISTYGSDLVVGIADEIIGRAHGGLYD
ncbi:hypothetical protein MCERE10_01814 [Burkholderiaceae bacterium]